LIERFLCFLESEFNLLELCADCNAYLELQMGRDFGLEYS